MPKKLHRTKSKQRVKFKSAHRKNFQQTASEASPSLVNEDLYLLGRPKLREFLRYVDKHAVDAPAEDKLIAEWKAAKTIIDGLEKSESGAADNPSIKKIELNDFYKPLITEFLKDPIAQNSFNTVPCEIAFVELDRLVVYQKHIDLNHVDAIKKRLGASPSEEQIFQTCLPSEHYQPPVQWARVDSNTYTFVSPSNDLRYLSSMSLEPKNIVDYPPPGNLVGVVGLAVGFGSNFLNAMYIGKRLILNNGSHRAYALRDLGITHVPCIVEHIGSLDELDVLASSIVEEKEHYLDHPRPAMLKDYFNPQLRKIMAVHRRLRQITLKFEIDEAFVPTL